MLMDLLVAPHLEGAEVPRRRGHRRPSAHPAATPASHRHTQRLANGDPVGGDAGVSAARFESSIKQRGSAAPGTRTAGAGGIVGIAHELDDGVGSGEIPYAPVMLPGTRSADHPPGFMLLNAISSYITLLADPDRQLTQASVIDGSGGR